MKINYPVKYALMEVIEKVGWMPGLHEMEREYEVVCYIVSKCYLISDLTRYREDGSFAREYEVVFPYQASQFNRWKREIPVFNLIYGNCINANKVDFVFDTYEESLSYASIKNLELCKKSWVYLPYSKDTMKKIKEKEAEFNTKLAKYKVLEQQILHNTEDIKLGENNKLTNVVKFDDDGAKILSCSIYTILELFDRYQFVVYSISQEQYDTLLSSINEGKNENLNSLIGTSQNLVLHGIEKENVKENTLSFYTTESITDILHSCETYPEIDLNEIEGQVLRKQKK